MPKRPSLPSGPSQSMEGTMVRAQAAPVELGAVSVVPAIAERWPDMEQLFGEHGAYAGCWCMFWRLDRAEFKKLKGEGTKAEMRHLVLNDRVPGVLAYVGDEAVGWCSIGPRENFAALESSRILKRVDDQPVWSIVCFFVTKPARTKGLMQALISGAVDYARQQGAHIIEGYPIDMQTPLLAGQKLVGYAGYMGIASAFREVGFVEVGRASETQLIMRYTIE
jgi:GNAT superfamily N-acetyltransferase